MQLWSGPRRGRALRRRGGAHLWTAPEGTRQKSSGGCPSALALVPCSSAFPRVSLTLPFCWLAADLLPEPGVFPYLLDFSQLFTPGTAGSPTGLPQPNPGRQLPWGGCEPREKLSWKERKPDDPKAEPSPSPPSQTFWDYSDTHYQACWCRGFRFPRVNTFLSKYPLSLLRYCQPFHYPALDRRMVRDRHQHRLEPKGISTAPFHTPARVCFFWDGPDQS